MDTDNIFDLNEIPLSLLDEAYFDYEEYYETFDIYSSSDNKNHYWQSVKYQGENGLFGIKSANGDILEDAKYDQIEYCEDYIYLHYGERHKFIYSNGVCYDCKDSVDEYEFYEKGKVGLKDENGNILLEAKYDEIIDYNGDCDIIYARNGDEYHYYNHGLQEILTDVRVIEEDNEPLHPFTLCEDQNTNVLTCVEPTNDPNATNVCHAFGQRVSMSRIGRSEVSSYFNTGNFVVKLDDDCLDDFYNKNTYIYSARKVRSSADKPIADCVNKLKDLGCYDSSWSFLVKISANQQTCIDINDLYEVVILFEDYDEYGVRPPLSIAFEYDNTLSIGEAQIFQVHYFRDNGPGFLKDDFLMEVLPNGSLDEAMKCFFSREDIEETKKICYWRVNELKERSWAETEKVLDFLYQQKCKCVNIITYCIIDGIHRFSYDEKTEAHYEYYRNLITWVLHHGGRLNNVIRGVTEIDYLQKQIDDILKYEDKYDALAINRLKGFIDFLKSMGGLTKSEYRAIMRSKVKGMTIQEVLMRE